MQEAMYLAGMSLASETIFDGWLFVVIESNPPFSVQVYDTDPKALIYGGQQFRKALNQYHECQKIGQFPVYDNGIQTIELPDYLLEETDGESSDSES